MNKRSKILFAILALIIASFACGTLSRELSLSNVRTASDSEGTNLTEQFSQGDIFFALADLENAPPGTIVEAKWLVVQVDGYDPGEIVYEQALSDFADETFTGLIYFQLSNDTGWPVGKYRVDMYLNGAYVEAKEFSVR